MKKLLSILIVFFFSFNIIACEQASDEDPQTVIDKAWEKLADKNAEYESGEIEFDIKAKLEIGTDKGNISGNGTVQFDSTDLEEAKTALKTKLSADGSLSGKSGKVDLEGEMKTIGKDMYVLLDNLNLDAGDPQTNLMANLIANLYKSQWIELPRPDLDTFETEPRSFQNKEVAAIAKKHNIFEVEKDLGRRKYQLVLNTDEVKEYFKEVAALNDETISNTDLAAIDNLSEEVEYELKVKISKEYDLEWIQANIKADDPENDQAVILEVEGNIGDEESDGYVELDFQGETPGHIRIDAEASHSPKSVNIEAPDNAQSFDPSALFGTGAGMPSNDALSDTTSDINLDGALEEFPTDMVAN